MQRVREYLTLGLLTLLPFHAFLVTVGTRVILGPGHAPIGVLAVWKEMLLLIILMIAIIEVAMYFRSSDSRIGAAGKFDILDLLIVGLLLLALLTAQSSQLAALLLGFKYDLLPLIAFLILRRVPWSPVFLRRGMMLLLGAGVVIAVYGIVSFILPLSFFTMLGYSGGHSLYVPEGPLAAFQQIGGSAIRRIQSVMSGPNQLGLWLLIPWSIALTQLREPFSQLAARVSQLLSIGLALLLTFSRAAWIGAVVILVGAIVMSLPRPKAARMIGGLCMAGCAGVLLLSMFLPNVLLRAQSTRGHWERPMEALRIIRDHPLGLGLGSAGPAQNRTNDACVFLEAGADASWAKGNPALCVFVDQQQVQPADRACDCPLLPENWYLQIGVEFGLIGMIIFFALIIVVLRRLSDHRSGDSGIAASGNVAFLAFLAICIAALFLHAWEDSAVAYTAWIMVAVALSETRRQPVSP